LQNWRFYISTSIKRPSVPLPSAVHPGSLVPAVAPKTSRHISQQALAATDSQSHARQVQKRFRTTQNSTKKLIFHNAALFFNTLTSRTRQMLLQELEF